MYSLNTAFIIYLAHSFGSSAVFPHIYTIVTKNSSGNTNSIVNRHIHGHIELDRKMNSTMFFFFFYFVSLLEFI